MFYAKIIDGKAFAQSVRNRCKRCHGALTPLGCLMMLQDYFGSNLSDKRADVVGRSNMVEKPMSALL